MEVEGYLPDPQERKKLWFMITLYDVHFFQHVSMCSVGFANLMGMPELKEEKGDKVYWCVQVQWWDKVKKNSN